MTIDKARAEGLRAGQEMMRKLCVEIAEKRIVHNPRLEYDAGWNRCAKIIEEEIRAIPIEGEKAFCGHDDSSWCDENCPQNRSEKS